MALLSERISTIEVNLRKSIQTNVNAVFDRTAHQMKSIDETRQSLNNLAKDINKKMDINTREINLKIEKMQKSTNEELKKIIKLITLNEEKRSRSCSCILL